MTEVLETPIKSQNDKNLYRLIKLANGLKVLLIQHPKEEPGSEKLSALTLNIDVGGYDDPKDAKGLSHFLEHMVFMGSEKYPRENEYHEFIANNGGDLNASTGFKETSYYFTIAEDAFEGALDRFSSIFISPLMLENSIERELESVESEYRSRMTSDYIRKLQVIYSNIKDDHQARAFIPGNLDTLKNSRTHTELYQLVHDHFRKYYVANRMALAVESSNSLDNLQGLIEKYFDSIKTGNARGEFIIEDYKNIFKPQFYEKIIYMKPKVDKRALILLWPMPSSIKYYRTNPLEYLFDLIQSEHPGGLVSFLKKKLLITSIDANYDGNVFGDAAIVSLAQITITMSEYGSQRVDEILEGLYSYLLFIQEAPMEKHQEIFENWQTIAENEFRFKESSSPITNTDQAVEGIKLYDDIDIIRSRKMTLEFNGDILKKYFDLINEPYFSMMIINHESEVDYDEIEPYFGTELKQVDMNENYRKIWNERTVLADFSLPPRNEYICSNFEIYSEMEGVSKMLHPEKIVENDVAESWYKLDSEFKIPKVGIYVKLQTPSIDSAFNIVLTKIIIEMASDFFLEKYASAADAELNSNLYLLSKDIIIGFTGYNEKMKTFISDVMQDFMNIHEYLEESSFEIYRAKVANMLKNSLVNGYYTSNLMKHITSQNESYEYEYHHMVNRVTFENIQKFINKFLKKLRIKILIQGNMLKDEAISITNIILNSFDAQPLDDPSIIEKVNRQLPVGRTSLKIKSFQNDEKNSWVQDFYDLGARSTFNDAIVALFHAILDEPVFDILRTKEQLAYQLGIVHRELDNSHLTVIKVKCQEEKFSAKFVADRVKNFFINDMKTIFDNLEDEKFLKIKEGKIRTLREPFQSFLSESFYNFSQISEGTYIFDEYEKQAVTFERITKQDLVDFYNKIFILEKHRNLNLQIVANVTEAEENMEMTMKFVTEKCDDEDVVITDIKEFSESLELYPKYIRKYE